MMVVYGITGDSTARLCKRSPARVFHHQKRLMRGARRVVAELALGGCGLFS